jgi:hypothetical protein
MKEELTRDGNTLLDSFKTEMKKKVSLVSCI